jgi:hypothetical protein|tara:strand:- start:9 stop:494 length:486 start_codon:yes stop_codon:yes gene_type:complete
MITKEYLKKHFYTAYFIDEARENIEILTTSEDEKHMIPTIIPFKQNNPQFQALTTVCSIDDLHENTYQKKKNEQQKFEDQVIRIAKKEGLILDSHKLDTKFFPLLVKAIFEDDNEDHLFAMKIALFELDKIKNAPNDDKKKKLRMAKTKIQALEAAFALIK